MKNKEPDVIIGQNIRSLRKAKGWSLKQMATPMGITYQQLQKYESGQNSLNPFRVCQTSRILEVEISDLLSGLEQWSNPEAKNMISVHQLDKESLELIQIFHGINNPEIKKSVLHILKAVNRRSLL